MRILRFFCALLWVMYISSCTNITHKEKELRQILGNSISLEFIEVLHTSDITMSFHDFLQQHDYISIVYLQNGCAPCYPKFMEWQEQIALMEPPPDYTVLFVIQGERYTQFIEEVNDYARENLGIDSVENNFPVAMDPDFDFLSSNHTIPRWIIDRSVLIDSQNRIRMVGVPWATPEMTELFQRICSEGKND